LNPVFFTERKGAGVALRLQGVRGVGGVRPSVGRNISTVREKAQPGMKRLEATLPQESHEPQAHAAAHSV
jgi:hypothetical protein